MSISEFTEKRNDIASPRCSRKRAKHRFGNSLYFTTMVANVPVAGRPTDPKRRPDHAMLISTVKVLGISVPNRPTYPLNCPLTLTVSQSRDRVTVIPTDLQDQEELRGSAPVRRRALEDFGRRFDYWVQKHWRVPPHLRTPENIRVVRILERAVNWDRYEAENPVVQPMWGKVIERLPSGSIRVRWVIGPDDTQNEETVLSKRDVVPSLAEMEPGQWFYGTAKCYPDHVCWIEQPEPAPAPDDMHARAALWRGLATECTNEPNCWPLIQK